MNWAAQVKDSVQWQAHFREMLKKVAHLFCVPTLPILKYLFLSWYYHVFEVLGVMGRAQLF